MGTCKYPLICWENGFVALLEDDPNKLEVSKAQGDCAPMVKFDVEKCRKIALEDPQ